MWLVAVMVGLSSSLLIDKLQDIPSAIVTGSISSGSLATMPAMRSEGTEASDADVASAIFPLRKIETRLSRPDDDFQLSGIVFDSQSAMAIVNNRIMRIGTQVNGATLLEIDPHSVRLASEDGDEFTLYLK